MKKKKILLVEDNPINARLERDFLFHNGFEVVVVNNGSEAYNTTLEEQPNLIIMDIQLFGISGVEAAKQIKNCPNTQHIPIIAVSAFSLEHMALEAPDTDTIFKKYIEKPIDFNIFLDEVNKHII